MKTITIRECAIRACGHSSVTKKLLYHICNEALTGEPIDWDGEFPSYTAQELSALYDAIAPDIIASVGDEESGDSNVAVHIAEILLDPESEI